MGRVPTSGKNSPVTAAAETGLASAPRPIEAREMYCAETVAKLFAGPRSVKSG